LAVIAQQVNLGGVILDVYAKIYWSVAGLAFPHRALIIMEMTAVGQLGTFSVILSDAMMIIYASDSMPPVEQPKASSTKILPSTGLP
jgi:hypothetical protein